MPMSDDKTIVHYDSEDFSDNTDDDLNIVKHPYLADMITAIHIHISSLSTDSKISAFSDLINKLETADYDTNDTNNVGKDLQLRKMVSKIVTEWKQSEDFILKKDEQRNKNNEVVPKFSTEKVIKDQGSLLNFNNDAKSSKKFINNFLAKYGQDSSNQFKNKILYNKNEINDLKQHVKLVTSQLKNNKQSHGFSNEDKGLVKILTDIKKDIDAITARFKTEHKNITQSVDNNDGQAAYDRQRAKEIVFLDKTMPVKKALAGLELSIDLCINDIISFRDDSKIIDGLTRVCEHSKVCVKKIEKLDGGNIFDKAIDGIKNAIKYISDAVIGHAKETTKNAKEMSNAIRSSSLTEETHDSTENHSLKN